jgi:hypothetical protein
MASHDSKSGASSGGLKSLQALLIFTSMVALIVAYKFLTQ